MNQPTPQQLAEIYPSTLHTRWGRSAFMGDPNTIISEDYVCDCDHCFKIRLTRWNEETNLSDKEIEINFGSEYESGIDYD